MKEMTFCTKKQFPAIIHFNYYSYGYFFNEIREKLIFQRKLFFFNITVAPPNVGDWIPWSTSSIGTNSNFDEVIKCNMLIEFPFFRKCCCL